MAEINFGGSRCSVGIAGGILHLEDGTSVNLIQIQETLNQMFGETGDNRLAEMSNQLAIITGLVQGPYGEWEELK